MCKQDFDKNIAAWKIANINSEFWILNAWRNHIIRLQYSEKTAPDIWSKIGLKHFLKKNLDWQKKEVLQTNKYKCHEDLTFLHSHFTLVFYNLHPTEEFILPSFGSPMIN